MEVTNLLAFTERKQLREWFEKNHLSEKCCWVACNRSKTPKPDTLPYIEIVEEALCFGWIDSTVCTGGLSPCAHISQPIGNTVLFVQQFIFAQ